MKFLVFDTRLSKFYIKTIAFKLDAPDCKSISMVWLIDQQAPYWQQI